MKILLAPWGDPTRWNKIKYELAGEETESASPLSLLEKKFDRVFILVPDSLIDIKQNNTVISSDVLEKKFKTYKDLVDAVSSFVKEKAKEIGISKCEVIVLPSFGSPGGNIEFHGNPEDYVSVGLIKLWNLLKSEREVDEIALDLTNGLNFINALTLRISEFLSDLKIIDRTGDKHILLTIYNSDPFSPDNKGRLHHIHEVYRETKNKINFPYLSIMGESKQLINKVMNSNENANEINKRYKEYVPTIMKSLYFPLPLVLLYNKGKKLDDSVLETWENGIKLEGNEVNRYFSLNSNKVYAYIFANIVLNKIPEEKLPGSIRNISENIYHKISPSSETLINKELGSLEKALEKLKDSGVESDLYCNISGYGESSDQAEPSKRNLIAHAGFQNDIVKLHSDGRMEYIIDIGTIMSKIK